MWSLELAQAPAKEEPFGSSVSTRNYVRSPDFWWT